MIFKKKDAFGAKGYFNLSYMTATQSKMHAEIKISGSYMLIVDLSR
jgi:hypothetical protein